MSSPPDTAAPASGRGSRLPSRKQPTRARSAGMPLMEPLRELRNRLIKGVPAIILGMVVGWLIYARAFSFITEPYCRIPIQNRIGCGPDGHPLVVTGVFDPFFVK